MKQYRFLLSVTFAAGTLFSVLPHASKASAEAPTVSGVYNNILSQQTDSNPEDGYYVVDINGDGIEELFLNFAVENGRFLTSRCEIYTCADNGNSYIPILVSSGVEALSLYEAADGDGFFTATLEPGNGEMNFYRHRMIDQGISSSNTSEFTGTMGMDGVIGFVSQNVPFEWQPFSELLDDTAEVLNNDTGKEDDLPADSDDSDEDDFWNFVEEEEDSFWTFEGDSNPAAEEELPVSERTTDTDSLLQNASLDGLVAGLSVYELETVLAYGPQEILGSYDRQSGQKPLNELIQSLDPDTGSFRVSFGHYGSRTTVNLEEMNRYFKAFTEFQWNCDNIDVIERGRYIAYAPATINFTAKIRNLTLSEENGALVLYYDYDYHRSSNGDGPDESYVKRKCAKLTPLGDGTYRIREIVEM